MAAIAELSPEEAKLFANINGPVWKERKPDGSIHYRGYLNETNSIGTPLCVVLIKRPNHSNFSPKETLSGGWGGGRSGG